MAKSLQEWIDTDVKEARSKSIKWLSQYYFFRDPPRPCYFDPSYFFSPADGIIIYQKCVQPGECIIDIKGRMFCLEDAMQDAHFDKECLVIGIFMTFFDVHINRIPLAGYLTYREIEKIHSFNSPMLNVEKELVYEARLAYHNAQYLFTNQRVLNRIYSPAVKQPYYVLQIADYDVDAIIPYTLKQNMHFHQNQRYSQVRFGSQVDLIVPTSKRYKYAFLLEAGIHVEAGIDPLIKITEPSD